ncbi:hypothetical protein AC629_28150 [Bradyrhizobium sp. NAS80.1]|nr:hypothetical protein AC629_28150 [Bradyrhizobium sp. NAS80.1]
MAKVDSAFAGFDKAVTKIEGVVPGFVDGKADELFENIKGLRELANTMKKKSASYIEDIRRSLLDVSEAANKMAGTPAVAPPAAPASQAHTAKAVTSSLSSPPGEDSSPTLVHRLCPTTRSARRPCRRRSG